MGNCHVHVDSHDPRDIAVFNKLHLGRIAITSLFSIFNEIDVDDRGKISATEFMVVHRIEDSAPIRLIWDSFNMHSMNFLEFSCLLWNFLSLDESRLPTYMFFIFNKKKVKTLEFAELSKYYHKFHGNLRNNAKLFAPLNAMEAKYGEKGITCSQFADFCAKYPVIHAPLIPLQFSFRQKLLGLDFWNALSTKRHRADAKHLMDPRYAYDLVMARRNEDNEDNEVAIGKSGGNSLGRRLSAVIPGKGKVTRANKSHKSTRNKETKIGHTARRLSAVLIPSQKHPVRTIVQGGDPAESLGGGKKKKKDRSSLYVRNTDKDNRRYGYNDGDPNDDRYDVKPSGKMSNTVNESKFDNGDIDEGGITKDTLNDKPKSLKKKKSYAKSKSKQICPEDDFCKFDDEGVGFDMNETQTKSQKSEKKIKKSNNFSGAVRRMSTSLSSSMANVSKKRKKKDRSHQYASYD